MKKVLHIFIFILCISNNIAALQISNINTNTLQEAISKNNVQLIDVRTAQEYESGFIKGAINIDVNSTEFTTEILKLDNTKPVYIYCLSGGRSANAAKIFANNNFKTIYNLEGGIMQWRHDAKPLILAAPEVNKSMSLQDYNTLINNSKPVLVEFYAKWCLPCKVLKPKVEEIKKEYANAVEVIFIDVDEHKQLSDELKINSIPELRFYKNGKQKFKLLGGTYSKKSILKKMKL